MKPTGIVRKVDELGRIVLPAGLRRALDIGEKDTLEISLEGSAIVLRKYHPTCIFCLFHGKSVCPKCLRELRAISLDEK